jgi:hypothetical protein
MVPDATSAPHMQLRNRWLVLRQTHVIGRDQPL